MKSLANNLYYTIGICTNEVFVHDWPISCQGGCIGKFDIKMLLHYCFMLQTLIPEMIPLSFARAHTVDLMLIWARVWRSCICSYFVAYTYYISADIFHYDAIYSIKCLFQFPIISLQCPVNYELEIITSSHNTSFLTQ